MSTQVRVPALPESVADATVVAWYKQPGELVRREENLVDLETDKVVLEVPASIPPREQPRLTGEAGRPEQRVAMTRLRARVAERLVQAQQTAAILTTFNEVDLTAVIGLRKRYKNQFEKTHGVRLGLMSFFVKAAGWRSCSTSRSSTPPWTRTTSSTTATTTSGWR